MINSVTLIGRLVKDPESKMTSSGTQVGSITIAVNHTKTDTSFFDVTFYGDTVSNIMQYLKKGNQVGINGQLKQSKWTGNDGQNKTKVFIQGRSWQNLEPKKNEDINPASNSDSDFPF